MCFTLLYRRSRSFPFFFFFNAAATTEIYTLSLHDALPILAPAALHAAVRQRPLPRRRARSAGGASLAKARARASRGDRKSTRLNSSHPSISYAVFCLKKKNNNKNKPTHDTIRR